MINIFNTKFEGRLDVAAAVGSDTTAMYVYDVAPGEGSSPYHYEYEEEWLLVVTGSVVARIPDGELELERGDLVRFPPGPAGAHKVMNRSDEPARTLLFSRAAVPGVSVYPDSNKIGVWPGNEEDDLIFLRDRAVSWSYGEDDWDKAS